MLFIHSGFLLYSFGFHILLQNSFVSFESSCWFVLVYTPLIVGRSFLRYFRISCFVCIVWPCPGIFRVALFPQSFYLYLPVVLSDVSTGFVFFCFCFCFFKCYHSVEYLCIFRSFVCCYTFSICPSNRISRPSFVFLIVLLREISILSLVSLLHKIRSFSSVKLSVEIFCNYLFTFTVFTFTPFQSWFLGDGNVLFCFFLFFFSTMSFFIKSIFFSSCVNIDVEQLGSVLFCFSINCVSARVNGSSWAYSSWFVHIFLDLKVKKQAFL